MSGEMKGAATCRYCEAGRPTRKPSDLEVHWYGGDILFHTGLGVGGKRFGGAICRATVPHGHAEKLDAVIRRAAGTRHRYKPKAPPCTHCHGTGREPTP